MRRARPLFVRFPAVAGAFLLLPLALAAPARAQSAEDINTARTLGHEGEDALDKKDFKTAEDRFSRADKLFHAPTLLLGLARAYAGEQKYVAAEEAYNRIIRENNTSSPTFQKAIEDARREIQDVAPKIAGVVITVAAAGGGDVPNPKVVLDDKPINAAALGVRRSVDPGDHVVHVTADGFKPGEAHFTATPGGTTNAPVSLEKDTSAPPLPPDTGPGAGAAAAGQGANPPPGGGAPAAGSADVGTPAKGNRTLAYVALGVGGALLVTGAVTGVLALGKHSSLNSSCPGGTCTPDQQSNIDSYHTMGLVSTVGFIGGAVVGGLGAYLFFTSSPAQPAKTGVVPYLGPGTLGAYGRF
jgi:hypothetical protein